MQIRVLEKPFFRDKGDIFHFDDVRTVSQEDGEYYCGNGWAEDTGGEFPTGEREVNNTRLDIRKVVVDQKAMRVG